MIDNLLLIIYVLGFVITFVVEFFMLGDRFLPALGKSVIWFLWIIVLFFHRPPKDY